MGDLSEHFNRAEFACHHCGKVQVERQLVEKLEELRHELGDVPVEVVSGYRCPEHNRAVGGAPHSFHVRGMAADIRVPGVPLYRVAIAAVKVGFSGVGYYPHMRHNFVHVDIGIGPKRPQWWVKRHPEGEYEYMFSPRR